MTQELLADLKKAAEAPAPKDFRPGVTYFGRMPAEITTEALPAMETEEEWEQAVRDMGIHLPEGYGLVLERAELAGSTNDAAWHRDPERVGEKHTAYTAPNTIRRWRYRFKVVLKSPRSDVDIAVLMKEAKKAGRGTPLRDTTGGTRVINLADFQFGKTDILGGSAETLERSERALIQVLAEVRRTRPKQILLVDGGDSTEGFESSPNAERTNDLQQTEQIRVWRRVFWRWIETLAKLTTDLVVISVPSNHCRVRRGKQTLGTALDDWGIEVLAQVADIAKVNPEAYGHVRFMIPNDHEEHVLFTTVSGKVFGAIHGHQVNRPDQIGDMLKKNSRSGIGIADIISVSHFHHLRLVAFGDGQWYLINPTMDGGSSWFQYSGERSDPGVLSYSIDETGWHSLHVAWV